MKLPQNLSRPLPRMQYMRMANTDAMDHINEFADIELSSTCRFNPEIMMLNYERGLFDEEPDHLWYAGRSVTKRHNPEY